MEYKKFFDKKPMILTFQANPFVKHNNHPTPGKTKKKKKFSPQNVIQCYSDYVFFKINRLFFPCITHKLLCALVSVSFLRIPHSQQFSTTKKPAFSSYFMCGDFLFYILNCDRFVTIYIYIYIF